MTEIEITGTPATQISTSTNHPLPDGYIVKRALFHQSVELRGLATTNTFYNKSEEGVGRGRSGINMVYNRDGLFCDYKGQLYIVPLANVICVWL